MNLPNKLTVIRMCMIPLFLALFFSGLGHKNLWALVVFVIASLTDLADGKIARSRGLVTDFGKLMDPLADKLLVMSAMICFVSSGFAHPVVVILILAREFLVTAIRQIAAANGKVLAADYWGKVKTVLQMIWICVGLLGMHLLWISGDTLSLRVLSDRTDAFRFLHPIYHVLTVAVVALTVLSGVRYLWQNRSLFADM